MSKLLGPGITVASIAITFLAWALGWPLVFSCSSVVVISIVIWQACDPFADAAQWIGERFHLPGSVRGATLDAIASSLPELFTGIFFVMTAMWATNSDVSQAEASGEGYGATVATVAGSAVYNMILIPAFVALVISYARKDRPTVDVEDKVILRDGVSFLFCSILLLAFLFLNELHWWMGLVFIAAYVFYIQMLYSDWKRFERVKKAFLTAGIDTAPEDVQATLTEQGHRSPLGLVEQVQAELHRRGNDTDGEEEEEEDEDAEVLFGAFSVPLNDFTAWAIIVVATVIAAAACYFLVEVTYEMSDLLNVPTFFIAVIVAAAASSVPDTFISIGAGLRGDDSGAVSNAFGSNIFDICICLSVPLLLNCALNNWEPISLLQDGKPMTGLIGLRILLAVLTVVTLAIMWHNRQLTRGKAIVLCCLYGIFIAYAVLGSLQIITV